MLLSESECFAHLATSRHGVLATVHQVRGVDAVPVVYAVHHGCVVLPIDRIKAKRTLTLQRVRNITRDSRCLLLIEGWEEDWTRLWWVQVHGRAAILDSVTTERALKVLIERYPQYGREGAVVAALGLWPQRLSGWAATAGTV